MFRSGRHSAQELRLLQLLSARYPTITAAHIEMMNLHAILALPKGTDHYISDIHGAYEQFDHVLRHASGAIQRKVRQTFQDALSEAEMVQIAMLIYYPELTLKHSNQGDRAAWLRRRIVQLAEVGRTASEKYTRSKVRKRLPADMAYILDELLSGREGANDQKEQYYQQIIDSMIELGEGERAIIELAYVIQRLVVDRLYILGDIYDRGPAAEKVMDRLMAYGEVSIQWGNHDVSWMGAASGSPALVANVVRLALRYDTIETLEDGYGISLRRLALFARQTYGDDACAVFQPKANNGREGYSRAAVARMHKAITLMQFKLEEQVIRRHPEYAMDDRLLLDQIDSKRGTITLANQSYPLLDTHWPTLGDTDRDQLSDGEAAVIDDLCHQFFHSARLRAHMQFLYSYGNMFEVQDGNLKFHGYLPVDETGAFVDVPLDGELLAGPALMERFQQLARQAFFSSDAAAKQTGQDAMWYLWCGPQSPLFGRARMTTFERYLVEDKRTHDEPKGPYYALRDSEPFCQRVLEAFGGDPQHGRIINGHTPVKVRKGEQPLLANGRLIVIDGGMSEAYQPVTGIAGYTLIGNSHALILAAHEPFSDAETMIAQGTDPTPQTTLVAQFVQRQLIANTDTGQLLHGQLEDLQALVQAYRDGVLVEKRR